MVRLKPGQTIDAGDRRARAGVQPQIREATMPHDWRRPGAADSTSRDGLTLVEGGTPAARSCGSDTSDRC